MIPVLVDGVAVDYQGLPVRYRDTVQMYVEHGLSPGTGWSLVFANELSAVAYCDYEMVKDLPRIWNWIHNQAPSGCHGNALKIGAWMRARRAQ